MGKSLALLLAVILIFISACGDTVVTDKHGRKEIVMMVPRRNEYFTKQIIDFNKNNREYFITLIDYDTLGHILHGDELPEPSVVREAFREALRQVDLSIAVKSKNRKSPDIVVLDGATYHKHARRGTLADLTGFFDRDIDRAAVYENVFKALEVKGRLHGITPYFGFSALFMDEATADMDLSLAALVSLQKGSDYPILGHETKMDNFAGWFTLYQDGFIDWETWSCDFGSPDFISLLEMSDNLPQVYENTYFTTVNAAIKRNLPVILHRVYAEYGDYQFMDVLFAGGMVCAGYPGWENVVTIDTVNIYAIPEHSRYKEVAWGFISDLISEEFQLAHIDTEVNRMNWIGTNPWLPGTPVSRNAHARLLAEGLTPESPGRGHLGFELMKVTHLDPALMAEYLGILEREMRFSPQDETIHAIITEEVAVYFDGHISREKLIDHLNNRVQLYMNEAETN